MPFFVSSDLALIYWDIWGMAIKRCKTDSFEAGVVAKMW
jgi:hypothetical protein